MKIKFVTMIIIVLTPFFGAAQVHIGNGVDTMNECIVYDPMVKMDIPFLGKSFLGCENLSGWKNRAYELPEGVYSELCWRFESEFTSPKLCVACSLD